MTPILYKDPPITEAKQAEGDVDISDKCCCLEHVGDNPACPKHGHLYREYREDVEFGSAEWFAALPEESF